MSQVQLSTKDVVAAVGHSPKGVPGLVTKTGKLCNSLGRAHKGWTLVSLQNTAVDSSQDALTEALRCLEDMYTNAEVKLDRNTFQFGRRNLVCSVILYSPYTVVYSSSTLRQQPPGTYTVRTQFVRSSYIFVQLKRTSSYYIDELDEPCTNHVRTRYDIYELLTNY